MPKVGQPNFTTDQNMHLRIKRSAERRKSAKERMVQVKSDDLTKMIERNIDAVAPDLNTAIQRHIVPIVNKAIAEWPIRTGESRESIALRYEVPPEGFTIVVEVNADYSSAVTMPGSGKNAADALIFEPGKNAAWAMMIDLSLALARG